MFSLSVSLSRYNVTCNMYQCRHSCRPITRKYFAGVANGTAFVLPNCRKLGHGERPARLRAKFAMYHCLLLSRDQWRKHGWARMGTTTYLGHGESWIYRNSEFCGCCGPRGVARNLFGEYKSFWGHKTVE